MYLFTRRTRLAGGDGAAGVTWAASIAAKVNEVTGQEVQLWGTVYSPGFGTISWTGWFADLASLEQVGDKLQADPGMQKLANDGTKFTDGSLDDGLLQPIYGEPDASAPRAVRGRRRRSRRRGQPRARDGGRGRDRAEVREDHRPPDDVRPLRDRTVRRRRLAHRIRERRRDGEGRGRAGGRPELAEAIDSTKGCWVEDPATTQATIYRRLA